VSEPLRCAECGEIIEIDMSPEEAEREAAAEAFELFDVADPAKHPDMVPVCGPCFREAMARNGRELPS
jgi:hypothetical protein